MIPCLLPVIIMALSFWLLADLKSRTKVLSPLMTPHTFVSKIYLKLVHTAFSEIDTFKVSRSKITCCDVSIKCLTL